MSELLDALRQHRRWHTARQVQRIAPDYSPDELADELAALVTAGLVVTIDSHVIGQAWKAAVNVPQDSPQDN